MLYSVRSSPVPEVKNESGNTSKETGIKGQTVTSQKGESERAMTGADVVQGKKIGVKENENGLILLKQSKL